MLRVRLVTDIAELIAIREAWEDLVKRSSCNEPMLTPDWLLAWWRVFCGAQGRALRAALFFDGTRLLGLAPLSERPCRHRTGIPFRRLELLASGEDEADEICSVYLGVIVERGAESDVAHALADALAGTLLGRWDELVMPAMRADSALPVLLAQKLRHHGLQARIEVTHASPYIALPSRWEDYLGALSASHRYLVRRSMRDLESWAGGALRFERARTSAELERGRELLYRLHSERWSAKGRAGVFASPRFREFHDEVMPALFDRGALDLAWLQARGEPIAALYNIVWQNKLYFYQSGRKVDLPKGLRPGIAMHAYAIRTAIAEGRREYDFLDSPCRYKLALALSTRPLVELRATRPSLGDSARRAAELVAQQLRALKRRALTKWSAALPLSRVIAT
jgi:CelD/BcsL family acetyltransferase involved in cellulose biosynthesis